MQPGVWANGSFYLCVDGGLATRYSHPTHIASHRGYLFLSTVRGSISMVVSPAFHRPQVFGDRVIPQFSAARNMPSTVRHHRLMRGVVPIFKGRTHHREARAFPGCFLEMATQKLHCLPGTDEPEHLQQRSSHARWRSRSEAIKPCARRQHQLHDLRGGHEHARPGTARAAGGLGPDRPWSQAPVPVHE